MVFGTRAAMAVFKTKGGRLWNKPWGLKRMTKTQKENRKKTAELVVRNSEVLKMAAKREEMVTMMSPAAAAAAATSPTESLGAQP
mmetsp:Transcript_32173/g.91288  ORF Transcript_32173/g.91288 Transcript_32173/m.91288 type:complete len:85 (-) Transcript_32173:390-644(-)